MKSNRRFFKAVRSMRKTWTPPKTLMADSFRSFRKYIGLEEALNLMVLGSARHSQLHQSRVIAQRQQAARAVFAAANEGNVRLLGSKKQGGDRLIEIPASYFQTPRALGPEANSIVSDLDGATGVTMVQFVTARQGEHQSWFNVQIERESLIKWIMSLLPVQPSNRSLKEDAGANTIRNW